MLIRRVADELEETGGYDNLLRVLVDGQRGVMPLSRPASKLRHCVGGAVEILSQVQFPGQPIQPLIPRINRLASSFRFRWFEVFEFCSHWSTAPVFLLVVWVVCWRRQSPNCALGECKPLGTAGEARQQGPARGQFTRRAATTLGRWCLLP